MSDHVTVETTTDDRTLAETIARAAIERRVAACARITAVDSVYRWKGEVETAVELVVELKTTAAAREAAQALILELHTYDLPEIVVRPILSGSKAYLDWVSAEVA